MYNLKEEIVRLFNRVKSEVWYWDTKENGLCEGDKASSENKETLRSQLYVIFRHHGYVPHFNCKIAITPIEDEDNWSCLVIASVVWIDRYGKMDYILNFNLGRFIKSNNYGWEDNEE